MKMPVRVNLHSFVRVELSEYDQSNALRLGMRNIGRIEVATVGNVGQNKRWSVSI